MSFQNKNQQQQQQPSRLHLQPVVENNNRNSFNQPQAKGAKAQQQPQQITQQQIEPTPQQQQQQQQQVLPRRRPLVVMPPKTLALEFRCFTRTIGCHIGTKISDGCWYGIVNFFYCTKEFTNITVTSDKKVRPKPTRTTAERWDTYVLEEKERAKRACNSTIPAASYEYPSFDKLVEFLNDNNFIIQMSQVMADLGPCLYDKIVAQAFVDSIDRIKTKKSLTYFTHFTDRSDDLVAYGKREVNMKHAPEHILTSYMFTQKFREFIE